MRTKTNRVVKGVEITAEQVVAGLIDRLLYVEKQLATVRTELDQQLEMIAENQAKVTADGRSVRLVAMSADPNSSDVFDIEFDPKLVVGRKN